MGPACQLSRLGGVLGYWPYFPISCSRSMEGVGHVCDPSASRFPSGILCPVASLVMSCINSSLPGSPIVRLPQREWAPSRSEPPASR